MFNRVATFPQYNQILTQNMRLQSQFALANEQLSSGLKSSSFGGVSDDSQLIAQFEADISRSQDYIDNIQIAMDRVEIMYSSVQGILDVMAEFKSDLAGAFDGTQIQPAELQNVTQTYYEDVQGFLNVRMTGRFLFSGAATATTPVDVTDPLYPAFAVPTAADTNYYQGDTTQHTVLVAEGYRLTYGVTADHTGFEQALRALNLIINNPADPLAYEEAMGLIDNVESQLAAVMVDLSSDAATFLSRQSEHTAIRTHTEGFLAGLKEVDVGEASILLAQTETQLQASYSATSRILALSIVDYLRR